MFESNKLPENIRFVVMFDNLKSGNERKSVEVERHTDELIAYDRADELEKENPDGFYFVARCFDGDKLQAW